MKAGGDQSGAPAGRWREHSLRMAAATHELAETCDDLAMMGDYMDLAGRWLGKAEAPPPAEFERHEPQR
ncbi:MAG: hypothetical protein ACK41C_02580 [Phenylobacterium sp.]